MARPLDAAATPASVVLAAHGSPVDSSVNEVIQKTAARINENHPKWDIRAAFHYGSRDFETAVREARHDQLVVVPLLTSEGYFQRQFTQQFLSAFAEGSAPKNCRFAISGPIGTHPRVPHLLEKRVQHLLSECMLERDLVKILIVGHGSRRNAFSRNATNDLAEAFRANNPILAASICTAFIDDQPTIAEVYRLFAPASLVVIPFLISNGPHARQDIPNAVGLPALASNKEIQSRLDRAEENRSIVIDLPFGCWNEVDQLIVDRIFEGLHTLQLSALGTKEYSND